MISNSSTHWGSISRGLHWLTLILILGLATVGLLMTELPNSPFKIQVYALHKSFGLTVLALTLLRLLWRWLAGSPEAISGTRLEQWTAKAVHVLLYILLITLPLSGWLYNSASGFPLKWFNLISLPRLLGGYNPQVKQLAHEWHENGFYMLAVLLSLHAGAALYHHYVKKDDTLKRMTGKMP